MEVLLNTIWLVLAIGGFLFWRPESVRGTPADRGHNRSFAILALASALVLLFPVISLTDDLHGEQATMEDSSRSVIKARNPEQACLRPGSFPFMVAATPAAYSAAAPQLFSGAVVMVEAPAFCLALVSAHEGRSPPSKA